MANQSSPPGDFRHHDTLDERLREERPDELVYGGEPRDKFDESETEAAGDTHAGVLDDENDSTAEEAAVHVADEAPGATNSDTDSYTGEKV